MTIHQLDFYFPFLVFAYGLLISIALQIPALLKIADDRLPRHFVTQLKGHSALAWICLIVGSLWSLQNILLS
jgi:hypothetical protein